MIIHKFFTFLCLVPFFASCPFTLHAQTPVEQRIHEIIAHNTVQILSSYYSNTSLSDHYCTRGENYLLLEKYTEALDDFQVAYDLALDTDSSNGQISLIRSLFGQLISYGNLGNEEMTFLIQQELLHIVHFLNCPSAASEIVLTKSPHAPIVDWEPDSIPIDECLFRARSTAKRARDLYRGKGLKRSIVDACEQVITILLDNSERCCYQGWPWKMCLQQLLNKWHDWFQNGIPNNTKEVTLD
jgi:hypothetical protein